MTKIKGGTYLVLVLVLLSLFACSNDVQSGKIVSKTYQDTYTYQEMECWLYGKYSCLWWRNVTKVQPAHWYLALQDPNDPNHISAKSVTPEQYGIYRVGEHYP